MRPTGVMPRVGIPNYDPVEPVGAGRRVLGERDAFTLWFSLGIGLLVLQTGALLVPGLGARAALGAIGVGTAVGVGLLAAAGAVGADTGLSAMGTLRPALGARGALLAAALNALQLLGWAAFEVIAMRDAGLAVERSFGSAGHATLLTLGFGAAATAMAAFGPLSGVRHFLRTYGFALVGVAALLFTVLLLSDRRLPSIFTRRGDGSLTIGAGIDLIVALPISWLPLIADYTRFGRSTVAMSRGAFVGNALGTSWFCALGAGFALLAGDDALLLPRLAAALGGVPLLLILVDETENAFADLHSAAVSAALFGRRVGVATLSVGFGALATALALALPLSRFQNFLVLLGSVFAPLFGVLLADHFALRRRRIGFGAIGPAGQRDWFTHGFRIPTLIAWAAGIGCYRWIAADHPAWGATVPATALAFALQVIGGRRGAG